ncbi:MAG: MBL fold metallo-hydrolase [Alphaproteobacteria bacterium]|nr:MBL fold metallo-hydrolase [Alphaproteobacteria bacterium]
MKHVLITAAATALLAQGLAFAQASDATLAANAQARANLPADAEDEDFAARGFIATASEPRIRTASGQTVWDFSAYDFVQGPAPSTVHPSLWRHMGLLARHGLFQVSDRIYQVRGFDAANMSIIVGDTGLILIDPLTSVETAEAALALTRAHLGDKPVVAVIYTHSHADHFAGVRGVVDTARLRAGGTRIIAPEGFLEHAVSENVIAGNAMSRRAQLQFGAAVIPGPEGVMGVGIGPGVSAGTRSLLAPTEIITRTGQTLDIDGVQVVFQLTPGTEAPAEMNVFLPQLRALCLAENANATMHNVLTPRGALVRDAKVWADYLTESLRLYGADSDVMFTSHAWPRFGGDRVRDFIASHRDAYKYLHDQSVRLMNEGYTGEEIAERIALPESLNQRWFNRGYYGTMRHNSRAVYQRYMGWYDGNPAHLNTLPHEQSASRYIEAMGGARRVIARARQAMGQGDYRWAAELLDLAVFADPANDAARTLLAEAETQLGFQSESAIWRAMYLAAARELRQGPPPAAPVAQSLDFVAASPTEMLLDLLAVRLDPERAGETPLRLNLRFPDRDETFAVTVQNGVLVHERGVTLDNADASLVLPRALFLASMFTDQAPPLPVQGDAAAWARFRTLFPPPRGDFPIVTP